MGLKLESDMAHFHMDLCAEIFQARLGLQEYKEIGRNKGSLLCSQGICQSSVRGLLKHGSSPVQDGLGSGWPNPILILRRS